MGKRQVFNEYGVATGFQITEAVAHGPCVCHRKASLDSRWIVDASSVPGLGDGVLEDVNRKARTEVHAWRASTTATTTGHSEDHFKPLVDLVGATFSAIKRGSHEPSCESKRAKVRLSGHLPRSCVVPTFAVRNDLVVDR